jgi:hypothetical protein
LPGENRHDFETIRQMMVDEIQPETNIEWLWLLDLVELSWEILRYRRLKQRILELFRESAIASLLQRIDGAGMPPELLGVVRLRSQRNAADWSEDDSAAAEIQARLERNGYNAVAVNAEVHTLASKEFATFDNLMHAAQQRRMVLLREIAIRRELVKRARVVSKAMLSTMQ